MHTTHLRKVGGSIMLAVPPALLEQLHLQIGTTVGMAIDNGRLVISSANFPHYTLEELLAQCNPSEEMTEEDTTWLDTPPTGKELL